MNRTVTHLLLLCAVGVVVLFIDLGGPPLWDRDEPRNASCAREMMERGDWVVPTFNGDLRVLKPAMKYWLMISAYHLFGVSEFAARFWSAVSVLAAGWASYVLGRRLFNARAGLWGALILMTSVLVVTSGHMAKIDATLTLFSTLTLLLYVRVAFRPNDETGAANLTTPIPASRLAWVCIYSVVGLGGLAKGLPGIMPAGVIGVFLLIVRTPRSTATGIAGRALALVRPFAPGHFARTFWLMYPLTAVCVVLAVAGPWYVLVGLRTNGEFLRGFFLEHHLGRAMAPMENHSGPFLLYYLGTVGVGLFPWGVFLPTLLIWTVSRLRHDHPRRAACLLLSCWVGVYVVIFSCARTKLPGYIAPCFPGLALLLGGLIDELGDASLATVRSWMRFGVALFAGSGIVFTAGLAIASRFIPLEAWLGLIGLFLTAGGIVAFLLFRRDRPLQAMTAIAVAAVAFVGVAFGVCLPRVGAMQGHEAVCAALHKRNPDARIGFIGGIDPSWVFYAGHPIVPLVQKPPLAGSMRAWQVSPLAAEEFFRQSEDRFILASDESWKYAQQWLPADARVVAEIPRFFRKGRWLVIGHETRTEARLR